MTHVLSMQSRGGGRTTRMLEHAISLALKESKNVTIVGANNKHCRSMRDQIISLAPGEFDCGYSSMESKKNSYLLNSFIGLSGSKGRGCISFVLFSDVGEYARTQLERADYFGDIYYLNNLVLPDHYALECLYPNLLSAYLRWDKPQENKKEEQEEYFDRSRWRFEKKWT